MKKTIIFGTGQENEKSKFNEKKFLQIINFCIDNNVLTFDTSDNYLNTGKIENFWERVFQFQKKILR